MKRTWAASAVLGCLVAGVSVPATAAAGGFKIVLDTKLAGDDQMETITAPTRKSAFAFASQMADRSIPAGYRWNGRKWARTPLPKGLRGVVTQVTASSARHAWAAFHPDVPVVERRDCADRRLRAGSGSARILRWTGKKWVVEATFKNATISTIGAVTAKNVWAYGLDEAGYAAWHFNGGKWTRSPAPFLISGVSVVSAKEIWATGLDLAADSSFVVRFDGRRWTRPRIRQIAPDIKATETMPGRQTLIGEVHALGHDQVIVSGKIRRGTLCDTSTEESLTLRLKGRAWRREKPAVLKGFSLVDHASDGAGGVYALGDPLLGTGFDVFYALFHRTAKGKWTRRLEHARPGASSVLGIAHVPGTRSLWAVGNTYGRKDMNGFISLKGRP